MASLTRLTLSSERLVQILSLSSKLRSHRPTFLVSQCCFDNVQIAHRGLSYGSQCLHQKVKPSEESNLAPSKGDETGGSLQTSFAQKSESYSKSCNLKNEHVRS